MTDLSANPLSTAKIRQLLAAVGSTHAQDQADGPVTEYNWRDPHHFNRDQLGRLAAVMDQAAVRLAGVFRRFYNQEFEVSATSITQQFADEVRRCLDEEGSYCLTFSPEKGPPCGFLTLSAETARALAKKLLGDSGPADDPERPLSKLEESLLSDLVTAVLEGFLATWRPHHDLKPDSQACKGQPSIQFELTEEICRIVFQARRADETLEITLLLPCRRLAVPAGKTVAAMPRISPQELSHALMEHLHRMRVTVVARLASTAVSFREALDLGPGDVLLLEKPIDGPVEVVVDGRTLFQGRAARSHGRYAIAVTEPATGRTPETPNPKSPNKPQKG